MTMIVAKDQIPQSNLDPLLGQGDWCRFNRTLEEIHTAAEDWRKALDGVEKPWLCWHVNPEWCAVQQKLVKYAGWTPVVGFDPRFGKPAVQRGAIFIDFNKRFGFPNGWPYLPLEFVFLFTKRLAFWHSDLLCRLKTMDYLSETFQALKDGEMAAVLDKGGRRHLLNFKRHRFWELATCTTAGASRSQFENGCGWWRHFSHHPNCSSEKEKGRRLKYYWDHGTGIMYWKRHYGGKVKVLDGKRIEEGHCTSIGYRNYVRFASIRVKFLGRELDANYSLPGTAKRLGIAHLLQESAFG